MNLTLSTHAFPRRRPSILLSRAAWILMILTATLPACAQARGSNRAPAELHIRVNIVTVAAAFPTPATESAARDGVLFSVPHDGLKMSETEEVRALTPAETLALQPGKSGTAVLQTRTIVLP
jgi:hypothetical protein